MGKHDSVLARLANTPTPGTRPSPFLRDGWRDLNRKPTRGRRGLTAHAQRDGRTDHSLSPNDKTTRDRRPSRWFRRGGHVGDARRDRALGPREATHPDLASR